ncbi:tRNA pseudouridine(55) synthase TruB [Epidermidibacterium keratini]
MIDKPSGMTSHDVVARVRRIAGTRKVGHAGTLDPMATGVLIVGVNRATKLLGYITGHDKVYDATVRLGVATSTDDAEGETVTAVDANGVTDEQVRAAFAAQQGNRDQVPSSVSAIKVDGKRAYALARDGHEVALRARPVRIERVEIHQIRRDGEYVDVDVTVECSAGTYIRAIARDVGAELGVGGHLTALRRTSIGEVSLDDALTLEALAEQAEPVGVVLAEAVRRTLGSREITDEQARELSYGRRIEPETDGPEVVGAIAPDGEVIALVSASGKPVVVFAPA